jgi:hypothetical protein
MTTVTVGFPALVLDLSGQFTFLDITAPYVADSEFFAEADRMATIYARLDLSELPNDASFIVGGDTFLSLLERENYFAALSGEVQMKVSKNEKYIRAGWEPAGQQPLRLDLMASNPNVDLDLKGGCQLDFQRSKFGFFIDGSVKFDIGAFEANGKLNGLVDGNLPTVSGTRITIPTATGRIHFKGSATFPDFPDLSAEAEAMLEARLREVSRKPQLSASGDIKAVVRVFGQPIDVDYELDEIVLLKVN